APAASAAASDSSDETKAESLRGPPASPRPPRKSTSMPPEGTMGMRVPRPQSSAPPSGAATSYPPPRSAEPASSPTHFDSIAVHAIRVINTAAEDDGAEVAADELHARPGLAPQDEELEELEAYEEDEEPPDSLDEADVEPLSDAEQEIPVEVEAAALAETAAPVSELKPPPPPRRRAPAPPKKKKPRAPTRKRRPWWEEVFSEDFARSTYYLGSRHIQREVDFIDHSLGVAQGAVLL